MNKNPTYKELEQKVKELERRVDTLVFEKEKLSAAIDHSSIPTAVGGSDGSILAFNEKLENLIGYKASEIKNVTEWANILYPDKKYRDFVSKNITQALKGKPQDCTKFTITCKNGEEKFVEFHTSFFKGGLIIQFIDITEQNRTEKLLQSAYAKMQEIYKITSLVDADFKTICDQVLEALVRMTGSKYGFYGFISEDESFMNTYSWSGEAMKDCEIEDKPENFSICEAGVWGEAVRKRGPLILNDYSAGHPGKKGYPAGHVKLTSLLVVPFFSHGRIIMLAAVANRKAPYTQTDVESITEFFTSIQAIIDRLKAEEALRASEEKLRAIFEAAEKVSFIITDAQDPEPKIMEFSPGAEKIFGYSRNEMIGRPVSMLHMPDGAVRFPQIHRDLREGIPGFSGETKLLRKSGENFTAFFSTYPLINENGEMYAALGVSIDISEEKKLEERLRQVQKMESIGSLAGGIAHDFNNILFPIVGMAELLMEDLSPGSVGHENAQEILKAGKRGSDLVQQILAFSRQAEHKMMPVSIQLVLKEAIKLGRSSIPSYVEISQYFQNDCGLVMADPTQIHQIAMNLITNAFHAVEATGGKIHVKLKETALGGDDIPGSDFESSRYALLSVSDTGCGISPDVIDKIFDPYFTTKEQGKGTGLGLAVVYGIVKEHGGDIKVYSEVGKGSTFDVYLPLIKKRSHAESAETVKIHPTGEEHILLVDDEEVIIRLERQMLERLGYRVSYRTSSPDALKVFSANPYSFDLVITDMTMPTMTGDELARELIAVRGDIPIIICTGFSERIDEAKAATIGIKGVMMKPFVKSEMAGMLRKVLGQAKGTIQG